MNRKHRQLMTGVLASSLVCMVGAIAGGNEQYATVDSNARAKAFNVLEVSFPTQDEIGKLSFKFSSDGVTFHLGEVGLPRPWQLFRSVGYAKEQATILVPAVAGFGFGDAAFLFEEPGTYYLQWSVGFKDKNLEDIEINQIIEVAPALEADLEFLARLADPNLLRHLFGEDFFDRQTETVREKMLSPSGADYRALKVISQLLKATRAASLENVFLGHKLPKEEDKRRWGDALFQLAKEIPDSSYAPYAAYYAGCCYAVIGQNQIITTVRSRRVPGQRKDKLAETKLRFELTRKNRDCTRAYEAFVLAAERADDYLKPRALYQQAMLRGCAGKLEEMELLLSKAEAVVPGKGTIQKMVDKQREQMRHFRKELQKAEAPAPSE